MKKYAKHQILDGIAVIEILFERFDIFETPRFSKYILKLLEKLEYPNVIFDLQKVSAIDSIGFGCLVSTKNIFDEHKNEMVIVCPGSVIAKAFEVAGMTRFFKIFTGRDEALEYLKRKTPETA